MTLEQRLFLHRQMARILETAPPDVRLKLLDDFRAELKEPSPPRQCRCHQIPPGTTQVTPEAKELLRKASQ